VWGARGPVGALSKKETEGKTMGDGLHRQKGFLLGSSGDRGMRRGKGCLGKEKKKSSKDGRTLGVSWERLHQRGGGRLY